MVRELTDDELARALFAVEGRIASREADADSPLWGERSDILTEAGRRGLIDAT